MCNGKNYLGKNTVQLPRVMMQGEVFNGDIVEPFIEVVSMVTNGNFFTMMPIALSLAAEWMHLCGPFR